MSVQTSTGLAQYLAVTGSLKSAFDGGRIHIYSGTIPLTPDSAVFPDTTLWTITVDGDGTGLEFSDTPVGRALVKPTDAIWGGAILLSGTATYYRLVDSTDDGTESETAIRIQGTVASVAGADMFMSNPALVANPAVLAKVLTAFSLTLPME